MTKSDDELRGVVDGAKVVKLDQPRKQRQSNSPKTRELATIWADLITVDLDSSGVVDGLLPRTGMTVQYGASGAGKTFTAIDLACHVASGRPWRGMAVEQGIVVYVAAEGPESVKRRLYAWKRHHGVEHLPVLVVQSSVDLLNGDCETLVELVARVTREHGRVALVVIDTLARAMVGNENAPEDMGKFVAACTSIREAGDTHILVVHHSGKDEARGARGHSSLRAATDVEIEVTAGCIKVTKARDEEDGATFGFKLQPLELGTNKHGRVITTCVAIESEIQPRADAKAEKAVTGYAKVVLDALSSAICDHGQDPPPAPDIPRGIKAVPVARWCEAAMRYLPQAEGWRKREAFNRCQTSLVSKGAVRHVDGWVWIP